MVSLGVALYQWFGLDWLGWLVVLAPTNGRAIANLAQPNHLATLLVWGLLATWWAYVHRLARAPVVLVAAAMLLFGVAMTQSRTGAAEVLMLAAAAVVFRRPLATRGHAGALILLGAWFWIAFVGWAPLNDLLGRATAQTLEQRLAPGTRMLHWQLLIDAIAQRPWMGWGWNQVALAQFEMAPLHPASHEVIQYSHNLVLDLLVWNGIPIGVLACVASVSWFVWQVRLAQSAERVILLLAVATLLLHSMLELPHGYALFLLPAALMIGALHVAPIGHREPEVRRAVMALPLAALLLCLVLVIRGLLAHRRRMDGPSLPYGPNRQHGR